jgi:chromosome segregation ATPase
MPEDFDQNAPLGERLNKAFESLNRVHSTLSDIKQSLAVFGEKFSGIDARVTDLAACYKVLNEHHLDVEKDLNTVKLNFSQIQNDLVKFNKFMDTTNARLESLQDGQSELSVTLNTIKNTILIGLTIVGGLIGISIFVMEYVIK